MKKLVKVAVVFATAVCMSSAVFAMTDDQLVNSLTKLNDSQKVQVEHYLAKNALTDSQKDQVKAGYDKVVTLMNKEGVTDPSKLSKDAQKEAKDIVTSTASAIGAKVVFNADGTATVYNVDGTVAATVSDKVVKQTGNNTAVVATVASVLAIAGAAYLVNKKGFVNE